MNIQEPFFAAKILEIKKEQIKKSALFARGDWTRTSGIYVPNVALYQTELHLAATLSIIL